MKLIRWPLILWLLFVVLSSLAVGDDPTAPSAPEQLYIVAHTPWAAIQGASHPGWGWDVWAEELCPHPRPRQHRNPIRRWQRLMRLAARRQRRCRPPARRRRSRPTAASQTSPPAPAPVSQTQTAAVSGLETPAVKPGQRRGRRPTIGTHPVFCPTEGCRGPGKLGPHPDHWIVGAGTYTTQANGQQPMFQGQWCKTRFSETRGTVFFGLKTPQETVYRALKALAEGVGIRATARLFEVDVDTVLRWLRRAGQPSEKVSAYLMRNLQVEQAQLDERWTFVRKKEKTLSAWEKLYTEYGDTWGWVVFDPVNQLVLAMLVAERETEQAVGVLSRFKACLVEGCLPWLTSDQWPHYLQAILQVFGRWVQPARKGDRGRFPKPRLEPPEERQYATVHKKRRQGRVGSVTTQVIYGAPKAILARIKATRPGTKINTAFVERMNLTLRHWVRRLRRRGLTREQEAGLSGVASASGGG